MLDRADIYIHYADVTKKLEGSPNYIVTSYSEREDLVVIELNNHKCNAEMILSRTLELRPFAYRTEVNKYIQRELS